MPVLLRAQTPKITRLGSYPLGALQLSQFAHDMGCVAFLAFRGGKPYVIGGKTNLTPTNAPTTVRTEEGLSYDFTAASSQTASARIVPQIADSNASISVIARLKFRTLPATAAPAVMWTNDANHRGIGVGCDSSGHVLGVVVGGVSTQTVAGTNVFTGFVTVGGTTRSVGSPAVDLYENGSFIGTSAGGGGAAIQFTSDLRLGRDFGATLNFFDGQIAWAAVFNYGLGAAQHAAIAQHPERLLALKYPALTGSVITGGGGGGTIPIPTMPLLGVITNNEINRKGPVRRWHEPGRTVLQQRKRRRA